MFWFVAGILFCLYTLEGIDRGLYWRSNGSNGWNLAVSVVFWPVLHVAQYLKYKHLFKK